MIPAFNELKTTLIPGSTHFTWHEALWLDSIKSYAVPTTEQETEIIQLARILDRVRDLFKQPIHVNSWLRPSEYNKKIVQGAVFSRHISGSAVDFTVQGLNADYVRSQLKLRTDITSGCSFETDVSWVHMQNDGRSMWFGRPPRLAGVSK